MSRKPFLWRIRPRAYRAFLEKELKEKEEIERSRKIEERGRRRAIEIGRVIPLIIEKNLLAHISKDRGVVSLGMRMFYPDPVNDLTEPIRERIVRPPLLPHVKNTWAGEGIFFVETNFSTTEELYEFLSNHMSVRRLSFDEEEQLLPQMKSWVED